MHARGQIQMWQRANLFATKPAKSAIYNVPTSSSELFIIAEERQKQREREREREREGQERKSWVLFEPAGKLIWHNGNRCLPLAWHYAGFCRLLDFANNYDNHPIELFPRTWRRCGIFRECENFIAELTYADDPLNCIIIYKFPFYYYYYYYCYYYYYYYSWVYRPAHLQHTIRLQAVRGWKCSTIVSGEELWTEKLYRIAKLIGVYYYAFNAVKLIKGHR